MPISIVNAKIEDIKIIKPHVFTDNRGDYKKIYETQAYAAAGIAPVFTETSEITSSKGVLRGIHYQTVDSQAKLVHVIKGSVFDVAVDLRKNSKTFGKWQAFLLTDDKNEAVYIPEDFAHGFLVLEDNTIFTYQCSGVYRPEYCGGLMWNDKTLDILWPLDKIDNLVLSEKDRHNLSLADYKLSIE